MFFYVGPKYDVLKRVNPRNLTRLIWTTKRDNFNWKNDNQ